MKKFISKISAVSLLFVTLISPHQSFAQEAPVISPWAIKTVDAAQKSGIYPIQLGDFKKAVTIDEIKELDKKSDEKLAKYGLKKSTTFKAVEEKDSTTRKDILSRLYNTIAIYDEKANTDPIKYFSEQKVLSGSAKGLELDEKASLEMAITFYNRAVDKLITDNGKGAEGFLYKIEKNKNTVYLLGSIHIGNSDMYPLKKSITDAYKSSDEIFVEVNTQNPKVLQELTEQMKRTGNKTLKEELGEEYYNKLNKFLKEFQIPEGSLDTQKLWAINNTLSTLPMLVSDPNAPTYGTDANFLTLAALDGIKINELENVNTQVKALSSQSDEEYIKNIKEVLDMTKEEYLKSGAEELNTLKTSWIAGDNKKLVETLKLEENNEATKALFETRDPEMAKVIANLLEKGQGKTYFVIAGSGHFVPDTSARGYLEKMGYEVKEVK